MRLIDKMKPSKAGASGKGKKSAKSGGGKENLMSDVAAKRAMFPALAIPNDPSVRVCIRR
jgi:hypothetical protein